MSDFLKLLLGGSSLLGFTADVIAVYAFVLTVRARQYQDIPRKVATVVFGFVVSIGLFLLARNSTHWTLDTLVYGFAATYILLSCFTLVLASTILKGTRQDLRHYVMFAFTAVFSFLLGTALLLLLGRNLQVMCLLFYFCALLQVFYLIGEYLLKRYLELKGLPASSTHMSEYPLAFTAFVRELASLPRLFSLPTLEAGPVPAESPGLKVGAPPGSFAMAGRPHIEYRYWIMDVSLTVFTMTLGIILMLLNANYFRLVEPGG
jgi:hypothetical protein